MKRSMLMSVSFFFFIVFLSLPVFADPPNKQAYKAHKKEMEREHRKHHKEMEKERRKNHKEMKREERKHHKEMRKESRNHPNYGKHRGYRNRPYDKHRHYDHCDYKGHRYDYHGHWRSWDEWDKYARKNPHIYKNGRYYREDAHLMFRFCDPFTGACVFSSIGR